MARFARCDIRWEPPSSSDPTKRLCRRISPGPNAFCRLLLQIGGANIASADRALKAAAFLTRSQPVMPSKAGLLGGWLLACSSRTAARAIRPNTKVRIVALRIMPSILSADFANLQTAIESVPSSDAIHIDVMDNHFVPNLTLGLPVVESIRKITDKALDIHLMIEQPDRWAPAYAEVGAESVTFHVEAAAAPVRLARELRSRGARAAMALRPATPIEPYEDLLPELDMVLIMTVEPGFGGQSFLDLCLPKIARTRAMLDKLGGDIWLQIDGGVSVETIERCAAAGVDSFVAGSSVFGATDPDATVGRLRELAAAAA
jgi:ribulose-phosphate 3-epimerase